MNVQLVILMMVPVKIASLVLTIVLSVLVSIFQIMNVQFVMVNIDKEF